MRTCCQSGRTEPPAPVRGLIILALLVGWSAVAAPSTNTSPSDLLLIDRFGKAVHVPTNQVPRSLHPPPSLGLEQQIPTPSRGTPMPEEVQERIKQSKTGLAWSPTTPPVLMPYLGGVDEQPHLPAPSQSDLVTSALRA